MKIAKASRKGRQQNQKQNVKLRSNSIFGKFIENTRAYFGGNYKQYKKLFITFFRPSFKREKQIPNGLKLIQKK